VKSAGRVTFLKISDVDWIEAADYYVSLHVGGAAHLLRRSLADLERELDPAEFCRIHRSAIVNLFRVRNLEPNETGDYDVTLINGTRLRMSRTYRRQLQSRLGILK
jgi:two-component system LytT family response regulator